MSEKNLPNNYEKYLKAKKDIYERDIKAVIEKLSNVGFIISDQCSDKIISEESSCYHLAIALKRVSDARYNIFMFKEYTEDKEPIYSLITGFEDKDENV